MYRQILHNCIREIMHQRMMHQIHPFFIRNMLERMLEHIKGVESMRLFSTIKSKFNHAVAYDDPALWNDLKKTLLHMVKEEVKYRNGQQLVDSIQTILRIQAERECIASL